MTDSLATVPHASALTVDSSVSRLPDGSEMAMMERLASNFAAAGAGRSPEECFLKIHRGWELGIPVGTAMQSIHVFDGKTAYDATLMEGLARRQSTTVRFECEESTDTKCVYAVRRADWQKDFLVEWTIEDARRAGLVDRGKDEGAKKSNNWNKFPKEMLRARCKAAAARMVAPESLNGMWTNEEISDGAVQSFETAKPPLSRAEKLLTGEPTETERAMAALEESILKRIGAANCDDDRKGIVRDITAADKDGKLKGTSFIAVKNAYLGRWPSHGAKPLPTYAVVRSEVSDAADRDTSAP